MSAFHSPKVGPPAALGLLRISTDLALRITDLRKRLRCVGLLTFMVEEAVQGLEDFTRRAVRDLLGEGADVDISVVPACPSKAATQAVELVMVAYLEKSRPQHPGSLVQT